MTTNTFGDYVVDGPPVELEPSTTYRVEPTHHMGEALLKRADGVVVSKLLHRDLHETIQRGADTIAAEEDDRVLSELLDGQLMGGYVPPMIVLAGGSPTGRLTGYGGHGSITTEHLMQMMHDVRAGRIDQLDVPMEMSPADIERRFAERGIDYAAIERRVAEQHGIDMFDSMSIYDRGRNMHDMIIDHEPVNRRAQRGLDYGLAAAATMAGLFGTGPRGDYTPPKRKATTPVHDAKRAKRKAQNAARARNKSKR